MTIETLRGNNFQIAHCGNWEYATSFFNRDNLVKIGGDAHPWIRGDFCLLIPFYEFIAEVNGEICEG